MKTNKSIYRSLAAMLAAVFILTFLGTDICTLRANAEVTKTTEEYTIKHVYNPLLHHSEVPDTTGTKTVKQGLLRGAR